MACYDVPQAVRAVLGREAKEVNTGTGRTFGNLLRRYRDSANLTQEELAGRTGLTPQAISLLERGERRRPHRYTVEKLAEALRLTGQDLARFEAAARGSSSGRTTRHPLHDLPSPPTPLVGRELEVEGVTRLLVCEDVRLLTLTGPGGIGKTRLALEVAGHASGAFANGVVFVPLAPLEDPDLVPSALAETLGIKEVTGERLQETLTRHLRDGRSLLLLDNFEHLLRAAALVADLLGACPELTVLATSRAPLRLGGEHQFPVPPLPLPDVAGPMHVAVFERSPAVELFSQRARAVLPDFELTAANAGVVAGICRRLDGLPLAIELAAARVKLFPPQALLDRLDRGLQLLAGGGRDLPERQRTLRDAIAWSYDLLDAGVQALFRRLSVFAGGCTLEAVENICGSGAEGQVESVVLDGLTSLVDNSLVVALSDPSTYREGEELRFAMLETVREYALERLASVGEAEEAHRRHARHYLALAEAAQLEDSEWWDGAERLSRLMRLEREHDNLRAALRWAVEGREVETAARLALALWRFWMDRSHLSEGRRWIEAVLDLNGVGGRTGGAPPALPARTEAYLLHVAGILASMHGDYDRAVALHEAGMAAYRDLDHKRGMSASLRQLGVVACAQGDYESGVRLHEQALALARELGGTWDVAFNVCALADAVRGQGDLERATTLLEESLVLFRRLENPWGIGLALASFGSVACEAGDYARASRLYEESLNLYQRAGLTFGLPIRLEGLARVAAAQGQPERAARLCGMAAALREEVGWPLPPADRPEHERTEAAARAVLGEAAFESERAKGYALSLEEAIADALGDE